MNVLDLLKKSRVNCPHCQAGFDLGPDLEAIGKTAEKLIDKVLRPFEDHAEESTEEPLQGACLKIADVFDVSPSEALEMLENALHDEIVMDTVCDFLDDAPE